MFIHPKLSFSRILNKINKSIEVCDSDTKVVFVRVFKGVFGDNFSEYVEFVKYDNGCLFLRCFNSSVASEVVLNNKFIINEFNNKLSGYNKFTVKRLIFT